MLGTGLYEPLGDAIAHALCYLAKTLQALEKSWWGLPALEASATWTWSEGYSGQ